ncbi:MAG: ribonuclease R [Rhodospirillales bacterium]|nr:ribonuclease R [Rhodospirillales bacterium]
MRKQKKSPVRHPARNRSVPGGPPSDAVILKVCDIDIDGDLIARAEEWDEALRGPPPRIEIVPGDKGHSALAVGDRVLARVQVSADGVWEATVLRRLDTTPQNRILGVVRKHKTGLILDPANKKARTDYTIEAADLSGARPGDMVVAEVRPGHGLHRAKARIVDVIGRQTDIGAISLLSLHEMGLRPDFPASVEDAAQGLDVPEPGAREDLRDIPLVTIDGADARDFDDAVYAEPLPDGGFHLIVAIADVSWYVRPGGIIDAEAFLRGNSTYFPDRVVPMLPEALSNGLCSLVPHEPRACLAAHLWIDSAGHLVRSKFTRGLMRSAARLTYEQVQSAQDGAPDEMTAPLMVQAIPNLYRAYDILFAARRTRGALDLDLPERKIEIDARGKMVGVRTRVRLDSHKLIEEFMILANVAAAQTLESHKAPCVYRVHDRPSADKLDSAREFLESFGLSLPKGGQLVKPAQLNHLLLKAADHPYSHLVSEVILRAQAQARYSPENIGHFGLALEKYAHFTSPIRRYADLVVHRALVAALGLGEGGLDKGEAVRMEEICQHISDSERISMEAERNAVDRFAAAFLADRVGAEFAGRIRGVTRFGLFVSLTESGADGLVPIRSLPSDFYIHDEKQHALVGRRTGRTYRLGAPVTVRLVEADGLTGGTILDIVGMDGAELIGMSFPPAPGAGRYEKRGGRRDGKKHGKNREKGPDGALDRDSKSVPPEPRPGKKPHRKGKSMNKKVSGKSKTKSKATPKKKDPRRW